MKNLIIIISIAFFSLVSCQKQEEIRIQDPLLMTYVSSFIQEGSSRQLQFDITTVNIKFAKLNTASAGVTKDGLIVIDSTSLAWHINPEGVVFHELGHFFLHRNHNDATIPPVSFLQAPIPVSIMHSSFRYAYSNSERNRYIDELFYAK